MKGFIVLLLCLLPFVSGEIIKFREYEEHWYSWKSYYERKYETDAEEEVRYAIWRDNLRKIQQHNSMGYSYTLGLNQFGDLTQDEYLCDNFRGFRPDLSKNMSEESLFVPPGGVHLPFKVDWRTKGFVSPVKDQGWCGSCWAFSATGSLEGQHFNKTGDLVSLSEQNLVDCSRKFGNLGCEGGLMVNAFKYIESNGGIDTESSYPYRGRTGSCHFDSDYVGATLKGFKRIREGNEHDLLSAVATVGPISVAIDSSHSSFQFYHDGVYDKPHCSSTHLDHAVLVVGYGTYEGKDYWLVKNSWGTQWGMQGYIMMSRNKDNQCGIATDAIYPLV
ncbi:hypothetical protein ABFA07_005629 [Porites harrisoni]